VLYQNFVDALGHHPGLRKVRSPFGVLFVLSSIFFSFIIQGGGETFCLKIAQPCVMLQMKATERYFPMEMFGFVCLFVFNILRTYFAELSQF